MTPRIPEEFYIRSIDGIPFVITGNTMPPRDPDEDDEDDEEQEVAPTNRRSCVNRTKTRA
jgi:hypothetical protein